MSLSHLYPHLTNDLHINNATDLHQSFPWLRPVQAKFTTIRVLTPVLRRHAHNVPVTLFPPSLFIKRRLALQLNSLIRVSRRAHQRCLTLDKFRCFALSVVEFFSSFVHTTCTLSVSLRYLALDGAYHPS